MVTCLKLQSWMLNALTFKSQLSRELLTPPLGQLGLSLTLLGWLSHQCSLLTAKQLVPNERL